MGNWVQQAITQWNEEGLELNPPATATDIENAEKHIGFSFPEDLKELYLTVNGFVDFEWKSSMISLWSLNRIVEDYNEIKRFIMFSDFSISLCQYGFAKDHTGIFKAFTHHQKEPAQFIARSFQEVIELINSDSELLF